MLSGRDLVFDRVAVDHRVVGQTTVHWRLRADISDLGPYEFQVQRGESDLAEADDWVNVGAATSGWSAAIATVETAGTPQWHYRVRLTTPTATYTSAAISAWGLLTRADWLKARSILRREALSQTRRRGTSGWLFRRRKRTALVTDPNVVDPVTGVILKTTGTAGVGTDRIGGYFTPAALRLDTAHESRSYQRDAQRGPVEADVMFGVGAAWPELSVGDVWASATSDLRAYVTGVKIMVELRGVPLLIEAAMRTVPPGDPVYDLALPATPPLDTGGRATL